MKINALIIDQSYLFFTILYTKCTQAIYKCIYTVYQCTVNTKLFVESSDMVPFIDTDP